MNAFWVAFYWVLVPLALGTGVLALVRDAKLRYGEPDLDSRLLFRSESIHAQSFSMRGAPPFRLWVTDHELVLRLRPGSRSSVHGGIETRIDADAVASVLQLPNGKIRLGLKGGEGRHWDFTTDHPKPLLEALRTLSNL